MAQRGVRIAKVVIFITGQEVVRVGGTVPVVGIGGREAVFGGVLVKTGTRDSKRRRSRKSRSTYAYKLFRLSGQVTGDIEVIKEKEG